MNYKAAQYKEIYSSVIKKKYFELTIKKFFDIIQKEKNYQNILCFNKIAAVRNESGQLILLQDYILACIQFIKVFREN